MKILKILNCEQRVEVLPPTLSLPQISCRDDGHYSNDCLNGNKLMSSTTYRYLLLQPFPVRIAVSLCSFTSLLRFSIVSAPLRSALVLAIITFLYVLWRLMRRCCLPLPRQTADVFFASRLAQKYDFTIGKNFLVLPLFIETSNVLLANRETG